MKIILESTVSDQRTLHCKDSLLICIADNSKEGVVLPGHKGSEQASVCKFFGFVFLELGVFFCLTLEEKVKPLL